MKKIIKLFKPNKKKYDLKKDLNKQYISEPKINEENQKKVSKIINKYNSEEIQPIIKQNKNKNYKQKEIIKIKNELDKMENEKREEKTNENTI